MKFVINWRHVLYVTDGEFGLPGSICLHFAGGQKVVIDMTLENARQAIIDAFKTDYKVNVT